MKLEHLEHLELTINSSIPQLLTQDVEEADRYFNGSHYEQLKAFMHYVQYYIGTEHFSQYL